MTVTGWKGLASPTPSPARADFPSWWDAHQKSAIATLCVLCALSQGRIVQVNVRGYIGRGRINFEPWTKELKDTNPLMSSLLVICLGWCSNFVGSESGQKQSVKLQQNMVYSTFNTHPPPPPQSHTLSVYTVQCMTVHIFSLAGGGGGQRKGTVEGRQYISIVPSSMG
jgi:hypothetical protein